MVDDQLRKLVYAIFEQHQEEDVGCDSCSQQLHCLWSLVQTGVAICDVLPAVEEHLRCCPDCREEFDAFISVMRADDAGLTTKIWLEAPPQS